MFSRDEPDPLGCTDLRELYDKLSPGFTGRCTAPLLVDLKARKVVSNESSDIVRMLDHATFGSTDKQRMELYPADLANHIDETNEWVYELLSNGKLSGLSFSWTLCQLDPIWSENSHSIHLLILN